MPLVFADSNKGSCDLCGGLPPSCLAQTGYGDSLPEAAHRLVAMELDNRRDVWRCPACGRLFDFEDLPQFFGSGNLDEQRLDRLADDQALWVYALLEPDLAGFPPDEVVREAARLLPDGLFYSILGHLVHRSKSFAALVPALAERLASANDQGLVGRLLDWASKDRDRLRELILLLERPREKPLPKFGEVLLGLAGERLAKLPS